MVFNLIDILPALPELLLAALALVLGLVAAFGGEEARNTRRVTRISLGGILLALALIWFGAANDETAFGGMHRADSFADYMKILVSRHVRGALYVNHSACQGGYQQAGILASCFAGACWHDAYDFGK